MYGPHEQELKRRALGQAPTTTRKNKNKNKKRKKKSGVVGSGAGRGSSSSSSNNKENRSSMSGGRSGVGRRPATATTSSSKKILLDPNRAGRDRRFTRDGSNTKKNRPQTSTGVRRRRRRSTEEEDEDEDDGGFDSSMEVRLEYLIFFEFFKFLPSKISHLFFYIYSLPPHSPGGVGSTKWKCT